MPAIESSNLVSTNTGGKIESRTASPVRKPNLDEGNKPKSLDTIGTTSNAKPTLQSLKEQYGPYVFNGHSTMYNFENSPLQFDRNTWRDSNDVWIDVRAIDKETLQKELEEPSAKLEPVPQKFHQELDKAAQDYANVPEDDRGYGGPGETADISQEFDKFICAHLYQLLQSPSKGSQDGNDSLSIKA